MRDIPMSDAEKWAILAELLHIPTREDHPQPNVTVKEYAEKYGLKETTAANKLEALVKSGKMKKATHVKMGSHTCNIYWPTALESPDTEQATHG